MEYEFPANSYIPVGAIIDTQEKADALKKVSEDNENFAKNVVKTNIQLSQSYFLKFDNIVCSCGVLCTSKAFKNLENK